MSTFNGTNPYDELEGLKAAITAAVEDAITRPVTVLNRDIDKFYTGTYPLIMLRLVDYTVTRIAGGQTGLKGQQGTKQNSYAIEIQDITDERDPGSNRVAVGQSDLYTLAGKIVDYFDHLPNQAMPVDDVATAYRAGEEIRFRLSRPYSQTASGPIVLMLAGTISVIGLPRSGQST